jgi:hypothetical protein
MLAGCPVLGWAASGGMALTGHADGPPVASPAAAFGLLSAVVGELAGVTGATGVEVRADPGELLAGRAALGGLRRRGRVSAGGSARLLRAADGWCAVNLSRDDDVAAVPAMIGALGLDDVDGVAAGRGADAGAGAAGLGAAAGGTAGGECARGGAGWGLGAGAGGADRRGVGGGAAGGGGGR